MARPPTSRSMSSTGTHRFRRAAAADAEGLRALTVRSMAYWPRHAAYLAEAARLMSLDAASIELDETWILEEDHRAIGFYRVSLDDDRAEIEELFLEPDRIGHGLGRLLFEHCAATVRGCGVARLEWECEGQTLGFYLAMGGQVIGSSPSGIPSEQPLARMVLKTD